MPDVNILIRTKDGNENYIYTDYDIFSRPKETGYVNGDWLTKTYYDNYNQILSHYDFYTNNISILDDVVLATSNKGRITWTITKVPNS